MYLGFVLEDSVGEKAKCRIAKRKLDMISGNVNSWARHVTSDENLKKVAETHELSAAMAQHHAEKDRGKEERKKKRKSKKRKSKKTEEKRWHRKQ